MKNHPMLRASHERLVELMAAGCPIDYPHALPRNSFRVEPLAGYIPSCVYALGPMDTGWVIPVRLATDRPSGTVITGWDLELPWQNHAIDWDCEPEDVIPNRDLDVYKHLFKSRLRGVLLERRLIRRGYPVERVLCGRSLLPMGKSSHGSISANLSFTDDRGNTVPLCIDLNVHTPRHSNAGRLLGGKARQRLCIEDHVHSVGQFNSGAVPTCPGSESGSLRDAAALSLSGGLPTILNAASSSQLSPNSPRADR
jgi:hypothetical protein